MVCDAAPYAVAPPQLGKSEGSDSFEGIAAGNTTFLIEVVGDRGADSHEHLQSTYQRILVAPWRGSNGNGKLIASEDFHLDPPR